MARTVAMVSRMMELRAELTSRRRQEGDRPAPQNSGDTPREILRKRLSDRERLEEMERRGLLKLGSGKIPDAFWEMPRPEDSEGEVMQALLDERESSR
jgi:hypothetical protein